jgi:hypothetical protein
MRYHPLHHNEPQHLVVLTEIAHQRALCGTTRAALSRPHQEPGSRICPRSPRGGAVRPWGGGSSGEIADVTDDNVLSLAVVVDR